MPLSYLVPCVFIKLKNNRRWDELLRAWKVYSTHFPCSYYFVKCLRYLGDFFDETQAGTAEVYYAMAYLTSLEHFAQTIEVPNCLCGLGRVYNCPFRWKSVGVLPNSLQPLHHLISSVYCLPKCINSEYSLQHSEGLLSCISRWAVFLQSSSLVEKSCFLTVRVWYSCLQTKRRKSRGFSANDEIVLDHFHQTSQEKLHFSNLCDLGNLHYWPIGWIKRKAVIKEAWQLPQRLQFSSESNQNSATSLRIIFAFSP